MKRGNLVIVFICLMFVIMTVPVNASTDTPIEKEVVLIQPRFTNISVFYNDFYITEKGKAVLTSYIDARNVDEYARLACVYRSIKMEDGLPLKIGLLQKVELFVE